MKKNFEEESQISKMDRIWRMSVNTHLLFNTSEEAFDMIRRKKKDMWLISDPVEISDIYFRINKRCEELTGYPLDFILDSYIEASHVFKSAEFWDNRRSPTRKSFSMKLFIMRYLPDSPLVKNVVNEISDDDRDHELIDKFYSKESLSEHIDVCFTVLLNYNIIRPFTEKPRKNMIPDKEKLLVFLQDLSVYLSRVFTGVFEKINLIDDYIVELEENDSQDLSIAKVWGILDEIGRTLLNLSIENVEKSNVRNYAFSLPGIWIDDADNGENRFWIFPSNYQMAFCYYLNENALELIPYEFSILSDGDISENDICVIITPEGNEKIITDGITPNDQAVYADFDVTLLEDSESIVEVSLTPLNRKVGYWFDWNKFTKLDKTDNRYSKFLEIIIEHYSSNEMKVVSKVKCDYTWMINIDSALVAIDNDYLYVAKPPQNLYFYLTKTDDDEFQYVHKKVSEGISGLSLLKPSSQNPIYLIRRKDSQYERFDSYFVTQNEEVRAEYERFKEVVINTNIDDQITFYDVMRHGKFLQRICFNRYSRMFDLNQMLKHYGVKKLTSITMEIRD